MDTLLHIYEVIINQPAETWTTIGTYLSGSTIVVVILQFIKVKIIKKPEDAKKLITFLLGVLAFAVTGADFALQNQALLQVQLAQSATIVLSGAVFIHRFAGSPAYKYLHQKLQAYSTFKLEVAEYRAAKTQVALPETPATPEQFNI